MSKKHSKKSSKKDDTSDSKTSSNKKSSFSERSKKKYEEAEIGKHNTKEHPTSQRLVGSTGHTKAKWSLDFQDITKSSPKDTVKNTKHVSGALMPAEDREKITMHFKNKTKCVGERSKMLSAAAFPSKGVSDTDVCCGPDVKRSKRELQDLRILNSREKNKRKSKVEHNKLKGKIVRCMLEDLKETIPPTECSSLPSKNPSKLYEFSRKQNIVKKLYPTFSTFDDFSDGNLHTQAFREDNLETAKHTSSELSHKSYKEIQHAPSDHLSKRSKCWKYHKLKEKQCSDSTKNMNNSQTQGKKSNPVTFHMGQRSETPCHSSVCEAIENTDADQEMQIVEDLHAARIDKKMALPVVQTCGELTSMEIDLPDDEANMFAKSLSGLNTLIVIDTNIMISHLAFIQFLKNTSIPGIGTFVLLIPWVVLQELDNLKRGKILANVGQKAVPAVHFIYTCLKSQDRKLWGQSMQLASQQMHGFSAENNDDRVLQCCLQYQNLFPQAEVVLLTDDKNLCSKALVSEVKAFSKADFFAALEKLSVNSATLSQDTSNAQLQSKEDPVSKEAKNSTDPLSSIMLDIEKSLGEILSFVLQREMLIAFGDLWTEVVYRKPPWTLTDLLVCYKKHWMAVFGQIIPRSFLSTIEYLYKELCPAKVINHSKIKTVLQQSQMLLEAFRARSDCDGVLSQALAQSGIRQNSSDALKSTSVNAACEKMEEVLLPQHTPEKESLLPVSLTQGNRHPEIWSVLENVWNTINLFSHEVFQKLDLNTIHPTQNVSSFKEAFLGLQKLMAAVNEILVGIRQVLMPNSRFQDVWALYTFLTNDEVNSSIKFTAEELYDCISQEVYRKRLSIGYDQLAQLEHRIKQCYESVCHENKIRGWL
ncbi:transcriptional protein SWT1 isoform X2 [Hemicordylus capensis]|uniref:transcriptional protein SWT1 isoform X2 n=1 Tax=Hemicordylus capensis TaxID=884348 RepID=UPI002304429C|nr:transcriptional protein SWT1 isoform X2 [Hemicordylus capensis]